MAETLLSAIERQALLTDTVIVSYSGGKDSAVVLDLACKYFKTVHAFFMYQVPELSFQEEILKWAEDKYGLEIYRVPHFEVSEFYRTGMFCRPQPHLPKVTVKDVYTHVRDACDCWWIAAGERAKDSIVRNAMIKKSGSIDQKRGRFFPLAYWNKEHVMRYVNHHKLMVSQESKVLGHSFRSLTVDELHKLNEFYPQDFERVCKAFPLARAALAHREMYG